jgi:ribonuclease-3
MKNNIADLEKRLGYSFTNKNLLKKALTHSSHTNESSKSPLDSYEVLEFLGDAILDLITRHILIERFPKLNEGELSKIKSKVVGGASFARIAHSLKVGDHLTLGKGEEKSGGRKKDSILAGAYEAIIAAIYLDADFDTVLNVSRNQILDVIESVFKEGFFRDFKTELQEFTQKHLKQTPSYNLIKEDGPEHERTFEVEVLVAEKSLGKGIGRSKKDAEQKAASQAFEQLGKNNLGKSDA